MDISKGQSEGQAFFNKGQPYGKSFSFLHSQEGLEELFNIVKTLQNKAGVSPVVILESTGHYHEPIVQFLEERVIHFIVVNPLISHQTKKSSLRKMKIEAVLCLPAL